MTRGISPLSHIADWQIDHIPFGMHACFRQQVNSSTEPSMTSVHLVEANSGSNSFLALASLDQAAMDAMPEAMYLCTRDGTVVRFNHKAVELWGRTPNSGDPEERFCGSFRLYRTDGALLPHDQCPMAAALQTGECFHNQEVVIEQPSGQRLTVLVNIAAFKDKDGHVNGAINCFRHITDRKHAEAALEDSERRLSERKRAEEILAKHRDQQAALYQFTDRLYRAETPIDVYQSALDAISRALGCNRASILLFDDAGIMRFAAWRDLSEDYRRAVEGHSPWTRDVKDPQPICIENIETADLSEALKATVKTEGIGALAFIPLVTKGELVGKFMTYYEAARVFSAAEVDLAVTIARQLGFGVERMRADQQKSTADLDHHEY